MIEKNEEIQKEIISLLQVSLSSLGGLDVIPQYRRYKEIEEIYYNMRKTVELIKKIRKKKITRKDYF
ncbi:MAG: hypothetical protein LBM93_09205 [Oscillospiraceae bacterium]|jgi:hypothetical protein|nr:hypothetical protein [Oscillospiraceae bacterium]